MVEQNKINQFYEKLLNSTHGQKFSKWNPEYLKNLIKQWFENNPKQNFASFCKYCPKPKNSVSPLGVEFWKFRGWSELDARTKAKEANAVIKRGPSPFTEAFYISKGYSKTQAIIEVGKRIPTRPEFYVYRYGINLEEAKLLAEEQKHKNDKSGSKNRNKENSRFSSKMCIEYWLVRGYSEELAKEEIKKEKQKTIFSLEKCIKKFGKIKGEEIWKKRQEKWQNTLNSKSKEEKNFINKRKGLSLQNYILKNLGNIELGKTQFKLFLDKNNLKYPNTENELLEILESVFSMRGYVQEELVKMPSRYFDLLDIKDPLQYCKDVFEDLWGTEISGNLDNKSQYGKMRYVNDSFGERILLRSNKEYKMYLELVKHNIKFTANKRYPNSNMQYDFYLPEYNLYIEICGFMNNDSYLAKMNFKHNTWGSVLLEKHSEMKNFVRKLIEN
jgi:hypothetical protein